MVFPVPDWGEEGSWEEAGKRREREFRVMRRREGDEEGARDVVREEFDGGQGALNSVGCFGIRCGELYSLEWRSAEYSVLWYRKVYSA
jgi:hypothetical protein